MNSMTTIVCCICLAACAGTVPPGHGGDDDTTTPGDPNNPGDPPGGGGDMTVAEFLTAIGMTECDDAFACKASFPTDAGVTFEDAFGASTSDCYAGAAAYYDPAKVDAAITAGTIDFDGAAAADCIAGIPAPTCSSYWTDGPAYPAACDSALVGKVADGAACTIDLECTNPESGCDPSTHKCAAQP
jgi:hypothetical protein